MTGKRSLDDVRAYWTDAARQDVDADGLRPTARDPFLQQAVEDAMEARLQPGASLIDIGCGDGRSTIRFARTTGRTLGVDYIESYVRQAEKLLAGAANPSVGFAQGNVLDLAPIVSRHGTFDIATSIRCLINVTDWSLQKQAIGQIASCVKPGGLYLVSEGWTEGVEGLNRLRERFGLPEFKVVEYNLTMRRNDFEKEAGRYFEIVDYVSLGFYIFMSRVYQPVFTAPAAPRHDHPINSVAAKLQASPEVRRTFDECDYAGVYVLRRRG